MKRWLWLGPAAAKVESVSREDLPSQPLQGFQIR
ncbi:acylphosphatase [Rhodanobacter lindaniclasticus]